LIIILPGRPALAGKVRIVEALARGLGWMIGAASLFLLPSVARADETMPADRFAIQPVADGAVIVTGAGFATFLAFILDTGEIQPLAVQSGAESRLLGIDRIAVTQTIDPHEGTYSDIGWLLGECVFTTIARSCLRASSAPVSDEWFTVRVAQAVFQMAPSHRAVVWASESLILVTALGALASHKVWDRQRLRPHTDRVQA
jgi:hypothetical protein